MAARLLWLAVSPAQPSARPREKFPCRRRTGLGVTRAAHIETEFAAANPAFFAPAFLAGSSRADGHIQEAHMEDAQVGWIAAIIIGGLAGWFASMFMKTDTGIFMNILLGIIGAAVASFLFGLLGITVGGWTGYLVAGFVGACILIWGARAVRGTA
jgi:uncharacterized membrane protein YeaQ/YmgE (transglycosylase-associated protein family)